MQPGLISRVISEIAKQEEDKKTSDFLVQLIKALRAVLRSKNYTLDASLLPMGHSYGGQVITNAAYDNPNITGLVYVAAFAPDEGQSLSDFIDITKLPPGFLMFDKGGFAYINPLMFHDGFAQDVNASESDIMAVVQKPANQSILAEKSGPPAWKQLPTWYQISENDRVIPPDVQRMFAERMNATTLSLNASHASLVSHPTEIADLILSATQGSK